MRDSLVYATSSDSSYNIKFWGTISGTILHTPNVEKWSQKKWVPSLSKAISFRDIPEILFLSYMNFSVNFGEYKKGKKHFNFTLGFPKFYTVTRVNTPYAYHDDETGEFYISSNTE